MVKGRGALGEHERQGQHPALLLLALPITIDSSWNYTATVVTTAGTFDIALDAEHRAQDW